MKKGLKEIGKLVSDEDGNVTILKEENNSEEAIEELNEKVDGLHENLNGVLSSLNDVLKKLDESENENDNELQDNIKRDNFIFSKTHLLVTDGKDHFAINTIRRANNVLQSVVQYSGSKKLSKPKWWKGTLEQLLSIVTHNVKQTYPSIEVKQNKSAPSNSAGPTKKLVDPHFMNICKLSNPITDYKLQEEEERNGKPLSIEIEMIRSGLFEHPWYGAMEWTEKKFKHIIKNFNSNAIGRNLSIDFNHDGRSVAAGWMKKLFVKPSTGGKVITLNSGRIVQLRDPSNAVSLFSKVELTKLGEGALRDNLYRYFSIEWSEDYKQKETVDGMRKSFGPTLMGGGLTNRPYIDKLQPILIQNAGKK